MTRSHIKQCLITNLEINKKYIIIYHYKKNDEKLTQMLTGKYIKTQSDAGNSYAYFTNVKDFYYKTIYADLKIAVCFSLYSSVFYERIFDSSIQLKMEEKSLRLILKNLIDPTFKHYLFDDFKEITLDIEELESDKGTDLKTVNEELEEIYISNFNEILES